MNHSWVPFNCSTLFFFYDYKFEKSGLPVCSTGSQDFQEGFARALSGSESALRHLQARWAQGHLAHGWWWEVSTGQAADDR